jgi:hypothetical protein
MRSLVRKILTVLVILGAAAVGASSCVLYDTGQDYYEACWAKKAKAQEDPLNWEEPRASSPSEAIRWAKCEIETQRAIYRSGLMFAGRVQDGDRAATALAAVCPSSWSDVPMAGAYYLTVDLVERNGGPLLAEKFLPARYMIERVWKARWPRCDAERRRQGYPKIVESAGGTFEWAHPCAKCG